MWPLLVVEDYWSWKRTIPAKAVLQPLVWCAHVHSYLAGRDVWTQRNKGPHYDWGFSALRFWGPLKTSGIAIVFSSIAAVVPRVHISQHVSKPEWASVERHYSTPLWLGAKPKLTAHFIISHPWICHMGQQRKTAQKLLGLLDLSLLRRSGRRIWPASCSWCWGCRFTPWLALLWSTLWSSLWLRLRFCNCFRFGFRLGDFQGPAGTCSKLLLWGSGKNA